MLKALTKLKLEKDFKRRFFTADIMPFVRNFTYEEINSWLNEDQI